MRKTIIIVLAIAALAVTGCKDKPKAPQATAPQATAPQGAIPAQPAQTDAAKVGVAPGADPHAGMKPQEIPVGAGHKGKVVSTMNAAGYTYIEVEEKGKKLWVAVMEIKVKVGDVVEFPDSQPMENFQSKSLNRTFEKIIFSPGIRVSGK